MIGKPEWFTPRKFGWGVGVRTKEGIIYIIAIAALFGFAANLPLPMEQRMFVFGGLLVLVIADIIQVMPAVYAKLDEREQKHQLIAERNASFAAIVLLLAWIAYEIYAVAPANPQVLPSAMLPPAMVMVAMAVVKGTTLLHLERDG